MDTNQNKVLLLFNHVCYIKLTISEGVLLTAYFPKEIIDRNEKMNPFPEYYELISFFESGPKLVDPEAPWFYNILRFDYKNDTENITCIIGPADRDMRIEWSREGHIIGKFDIKNFKGLEIENQKTPVLIVSFNETDQLSLFKLRLRPFVQIEWGTQLVP